MHLGISYAFSNHGTSLDSICLITQWPGASGKLGLKVPSEISYEPRPDGTSQRWGYQLRPGSKRYGGFKLHLDPEAGRTAYNDKFLASSLTIDPGNPFAMSDVAPGKTPTSMIADYLRLVLAAAMRELEEHFPAVLDNMAVKFVISTPAMWSLAGQQNTLAAAKAAGFGSRPQDVVELVSEPEAAATYAMRQLQAQQIGSKNSSLNSFEEKSLTWKCKSEPATFGGWKVSEIST
jgi:hypothetical protein